MCVSQMQLFPLCSRFPTSHFDSFRVCGFVCVLLSSCGVCVCVCVCACACVRVSNVANSMYHRFPISLSRLLSHTHAQLTDTLTHAQARPTHQWAFSTTNWVKSTIQTSRSGRSCVSFPTLASAKSRYALCMCLCPSPSFLSLSLSLPPSLFLCSSFPTLASAKYRYTLGVHARSQTHVYPHARQLVCILSKAHK